MTHADIANLFVPLMNVVTNPRFALWCGRGLSGTVLGFIVLDALMRLAPFAVLTERTVHLGLFASPELLRGVGIVGLACTLFYALPQTAALRGILFATQLTV